MSDPEGVDWAAYRDKNRKVMGDILRSGVVEEGGSLAIAVRFVAAREGVRADDVIEAFMAENIIATRAQAYRKLPEGIEAVVETQYEPEAFADALERVARIAEPLGCRTAGWMICG